MTEKTFETIVSVLVNSKIQAENNNKKGINAKECAGIIHTDFEKGFIRAEVISYQDLIDCGSELKAKEAGKARLEGKDYIMQDGDICHFRFNV